MFEATFVAEFRNGDGKLLVKKTVTATEGAPGRGAFVARVTLPAVSGKGRLVVYEVSMADGSHMNVVTIPLGFAVTG